MSERAQEYQEYQHNKENQERIADEDMKLLREPNSIQDLDDDSDDEDYEPEHRRKASFKSDESAAIVYDKGKNRKMTVESGRLDSTTKSTKESRFK